MTWTLFVVLLTGWSAGVMTGDSFGGGLHLLLLGAFVLLILQILGSGQRAPTRGHSA